MQRDPLDIAHAWLKQSSADLRAGERNRDTPFLACFLAQQSAEKALKALLYWRKGDAMRLHQIAKLLDELGEEFVDATIAADLRTLDKYYTTTRYPDSIDFASPEESFSQREATEALRIAASAVDAVRRLLPQPPPPTA
jgi:HEPN domain-containing protein